MNTLSGVMRLESAPACTGPSERKASPKGKPPEGKHLEWNAIPNRNRHLRKDCHPEGKHLRMDCSRKERTPGEKKNCKRMGKSRTVLPFHRGNCCRLPWFPFRSDALYVGARLIGRTRGAYACWSLLREFGPGR